MFGHIFIQFYNFLSILSHFFSGGGWCSGSDVPIIANVKNVAITLYTKCKQCIQNASNVYKMQAMYTKMIWDTLENVVSLF
jgi:hypothetical protein